MGIELRERIASSGIGAGAVAAEPSGPATSRRGFAIATDLFRPGGFVSAEQVEVPEWIKIFPYGEWKNPAYPGQHWIITREFGHQLAENFARRVIGRDIALDLHHQSTAAPGWIAEIQARDDGVYARVDWTDFGRELVAGRQYRYVSPQWHWEWIRASDNARFDSVLTGLALTNDPFFSELPPIATMQAENPRILGAQLAHGEHVGLTRAGGIIMGEELRTPTTQTTPRDSGQDGNAGGMAPAGGTGDDTGGLPAGGQATPGVDTASGAAADVAAAPATPPAVAPIAAAIAAAGARPNADGAAPLGGQAAVAEPTVAELQTQLATERQRGQANEAAMRAMERRETRATVLADLRAMPHPSNPRAFLAPQIAERWADLLCDLSDEAPAPVAAEAGATDDAAQAPLSPRAAMIDLIKATAQPWPEIGERGFSGEPAGSGEGMTAEAKSKELDKLAEARATEKKIEYKAAVIEVVAERPDLS